MVEAIEREGGKAVAMQAEATDAEAVKGAVEKTVKTFGRLDVLVNNAGTAIPKPFEETDPEGRVPPEVRAVILKALEKKREDRFASAEEFDREIVALRRQYADPEGLEGTRAIVSRARDTRDSLAVTVTPSAVGTDADPTMERERP